MSGLRCIDMSKFQVGDYVEVIHLADRLDYNSYQPGDRYHITEINRFGGVFLCYGDADNWVQEIGLKLVDDDYKDQWVEDFKKQIAQCDESNPYRVAEDAK